MSRIAVLSFVVLALLALACGPPGDKLDKKPGAMPDAGPTPDATAR